MRTKFSLMAVMLLLIAGCNGCAQLGLAPADSFTDRVAYANATLIGVLDTVTLGVDRGDLSSEDGEHILKIAGEARTLLDSAALVHSAGDISTANGRLLLATRVLNELQIYLRSKGVE